MTCCWYHCPFVCYSDSGVEEHSETQTDSDQSSHQDTCSVEAKIHSPGSPISLDSATDSKSVSMTVWCGRTKSEKY